MHSCLEHALIAKKSPNRFDNKFIKFLLDVRPVEQKNSQFIYLLTYSAQIFCFTGHPVEIFIAILYEIGNSKQFEAYLQISTGWPVESYWTPSRFY